MTQSGFFQQKRASPASLAIVIALHVGVLGAVIMAKGPQFMRPIDRTIIIDIPLKQPPPDNPPPPQQPRDQRAQIDRPITRIPLPPLSINPPLPPLDPITIDTGPTVTVTPPPPDPPPVREPVRRDATVDPRFASALQPPYPLGEQRAERTGTVRVRVTIGTDGRVKAVERLSATNDAFWEVARQQALNRWRFRPATLDGRPVESSKEMTIYFRLADI